MDRVNHHNYIWLRSYHVTSHMMTRLRMVHSRDSLSADGCVLKSIIDRDPEKTGIGLGRVVMKSGLGNW